MNRVVSFLWSSIRRLEYSMIRATAVLWKGRSRLSLHRDATKEAYLAIFSGLRSIKVSKSAMTLKYLRKSSSPMLSIRSNSG